MIRYFTYLLMTALYVFQSCDSYLDIKPRSNLVVPETLDDMEQLLDYGGLFNSYPELLELQADDFYFESNYWNSMFDQVNKNAYVWAEDIYGSTESHQAWSDQYLKIFYANAVLDGLDKMERKAANATRYDQIKGSALFLKAEAVYILAQLFAKVYDFQTADGDLGIPIPMSADVNEKLSRPNNQFTFEFIINSLLEAEKLLSPVVDFSRPSKPSANALLARVYLYMGVYDKALLHSDKSLKGFDGLIDLNAESIRDYKGTLLSRFISPNNDIKNLKISTLIDTVVIDSYKINDLRLLSFYQKNSSRSWVKKRFNNLVNLCFSGLDADEQYLIHSECSARIGLLDDALADLNHLLEKRFVSGKYIPYTSTDKNQVLSWVLQERRKELVFRGLRWSDLKRLNRDGANMTLKRILDEQVFNLPPNDLKWVLPIPNDEIKISKLIQNER